MKFVKIPVISLRFAAVFVILFALTNVESFAGAGGNKSKSKRSSQTTLWRQVDERNLESRGERLLMPEKYRVFRLNKAALSDLLVEMPLEFTEAAREKNLIIEVPMPNGKLSRFRIEESPVLAPHLAADFPTWKTFQGYGVDDPTVTGRFDWTNAGFHAYIFSAGGTVYIEPLQRNDTQNYMVFYKHEFGAERTGNFHCKFDEFISRTKMPDFFGFGTPAPAPFTNGANIRNYRIAIATTGEWARSFEVVLQDPQTVRLAAFTAITTNVNRLNGIYRRELGVSFTLANPSITDEAKNIVFDNPDTDPYDNTDNTAQLAINQTTIDARAGAMSYDIGHLFGTGGGGVASTPSVCSAQKAEGYSARNPPTGDPFTVDYVAHEIGHQFGANHTYNNNDDGGACTTRNPATAFEVGSGSTIMSYVGICSARNLQQFVDNVTPSFHVHSLTEMITYIQPGGGGNDCGTVEAQTNTIPTVNAGANFTIPRLTPFTLTATGGAQNLLYSWEQYDAAPSASGVVGEPAETFDVDTDGVLRPLFRVYSPVASASRTFPSLAFILNPANNNPAGSNNPPLTYQGAHPTGFSGATCSPMTDCVIGENLPSAARTMNFRVAVRDNRGGTADAGMQVTVDAAAGPFRVTTQDTPANWTTNSTQTVNWDVANTGAGTTVNAANVNILLSTDGGQTFPITLLANTPNDGTETITVPNNPTTQARIKVEAAGNIFFDINNANFQIVPAMAAAATVGGQILSPVGGGVTQARVYATDQNGVTQMVLSNASGHYRFSEIEPGQVYTFAVRHQRYRFTPQAVAVDGIVNNLNFTANSGIIR